jgi:hypothetical protein
MDVGPREATLIYTSRIYNLLATLFKTFYKTEEQQQIEYPLAGMDASHKLWKNALGHTNAFIFHKQQALLLSIANASKSTTSPNMDVRNINTYFQIEGHGPKLLEFESEPTTTEPIPYFKKKSGQSSFFWHWTHKLLGQSVKRFSSSSGKSFDTDMLISFLHQIRKRVRVVAYGSAQHILLLNESI